MNLNEVILQIQSGRHFHSDKGIVCKSYRLDDVMCLIEVDPSNIHKETTLITIIEYFNITHVTFAGNRYLKQCFEIFIHDIKFNEVKLQRNGWQIYSIKTWGNCEYGYPEKKDFEVIFCDKSGDLTKPYTSLGIFGSYSFRIIQFIELFKKAHASHNAKNFDLSMENEQLKSVIEQLKSEISNLEEKLANKIN